MKIYEATITAELADEEEGHEAIVATKAAVEAVKQIPTDAGLKNVHAHRRLVTKRDPAAKAVAGAPAAPALELAPEPEATFVRPNRAA